MRLRRRFANLVTGGLAHRGDTRAWIAGQLTLAAVLSIVATVAIELLLLPSGRYLSYAQLWLIITAGLLVQWFGRTVRAAPTPDEVGPEPPTPEFELPARAYPIAQRWEQRLSVTSGDPEWFVRVARDRLAVLIAERLRQRHGLGTRGSGGPVSAGARGVPAGSRELPAGSRAILGDELYEFMTAPVTRTPSPAELSRLITRMEQI